MPKKTKKAKGRLDKYYHLAKEAGYRSRAAFKLIQLNKQYDFLGSARSLLDLCAAPGGWLQVAVKYMPVSSLIVGVDLAPIKPIRGCITLTEDITTAKCRAALKREFKEYKCDVVVHDGAPNVGTAWALDAYGQSELTLAALKLATEFLAEGGIFLTKIFRSADYNSLLWVFHQLFKRVEATKPPASRGTSAEIYVYCKGFLAPAHIDSRLLDPKHVFKELDITNAGASQVDIFSDKTRRQRTGYETGREVLYRQAPVADFVLSATPIKLLAEFSALSFDADERSRLYAAAPETTDDIRACCEDLRVLGKKDFKSLLRWRIRMRDQDQLLQAQIKAEKAAADGDADGGAAAAPLTREEEEEQLDAELHEKIKGSAQKEKRARKKELKKIAKLRKKIELKMVIPNDTLETAGELGLFSRIDPLVRRNKDRLAAVPLEDRVAAAIDGDDADDDGVVMDVDLAPPKRRSSSTRAASASGDDASDAEDADPTYEEEMDTYLDSMYERFVEASRTRERNLRIGKKKKQWDDDRDAILLNGPGGDDDADDDADATAATTTTTTTSSSLGAGGSKKAALWFSQDIFRGAADDDDDDDDSSDDEDDRPDMPLRRTELGKRKEADAPGGGGTAAAVQKRVRAGGDDDDDEDGGGGGGGGLIFLRNVAQQGGRRDAPSAALTRAQAAAAAAAAASASVADREGGFEEVAAPADYDSDDMVEGLALGSMWIHKKQREELIDRSFNRYTWNNDGDLPAWFRDEEAQHQRPQLPITKEAAMEIRQKQKEIDARPIKKIAEARARRKKKAAERLDKLAKKANLISNTSESTDREKAKAIEKLYKGQNLGKVKSNKLYVVRRSFQSGGKSSASVKVVDKRLKKDKRGLKKAQKRGGHKKRGSRK